MFSKENITCTRYTNNNNKNKNQGKREILLYFNII